MILRILKKKYRREELSPKELRWIDINLHEKLPAAVISVLATYILWCSISWFNMEGEEYRPNHKTKFFSSKVYFSLNSAIDNLALRYKKATGQYHYYTTKK